MSTRAAAPVASSRNKSARLVSGTAIKIDTDGLSNKEQEGWLPPTKRASADARFDRPCMTFY